MRPQVLAFALCAAAACSRSSAELVLHIESDLSRDQVSQFSVEAIAADGSRDTSTFARTGAPQTLGVLAPHSDANAQLTVIVRAEGTRSLSAQRRLKSLLADRELHLFICVSDRCATSSSTCTRSFEPSLEIDDVETLANVDPPRDFLEGCLPREPMPAVDAGVFEDASFADAAPDVVEEDAMNEAPDAGDDAGVPDDGVVIMTDAGTTTTPCPSWWNTAWTRRQRVEIDNSGLTKALVDFPILIPLDEANINPTDLQGDAEDLRFIAGDQTTVLDYEIEMFGPGTSGWVWVRVPRIPTSTTGTTSISMYYGNPTAPDGQDHEAVWQSAYRAVFHMNQDPSDIPPQITDSTLHDNHASSNGSMPASALRLGMIGDGIAFDGSNDYLSIPPSSSMNFQNRTFSVELWANLDVVDIEQTLIGIHSEEMNNRSLHLRAQYDARVRVGYWGDDLTSQDPWAVANAWQYYVFSYDQSTDTTRIFVDGLEVASGPQGGFDGMTPEIAIARWRTFDEQYAGGTIDEVRFSSSARNDEWFYAQFRSMTRDNFVRFDNEESCP